MVVTSYPTVGLEVGMPRRGWYAKGIKLDIQGKYTQSYDAYLKADTEYRTLLRQRPRWKKIIRGWLEKTSFQREKSRMLRTPRNSRWRYWSHYFRFRYALNLHHKWLAIRAFTGRPNSALQSKVVTEYQNILVRSSRDHRPRIMLAAMYHEMGQRSRARRQFDRVPQRYRGRHNLEMAYYYSVAGDRKLAFQHLKTAARLYSNRSVARRSNLLDRLRTDPRFYKMVGAP